MKEKDLKRALVKALRAEMPGAVIFRHEDTFTAGIPDISVSWSGVTTWWEVKAEPLGRTSKPTKLQLYTLDTLARHVPAGLILYRDRKREGGKHTSVWLASDSPDSAERFQGWDHATVARLIREIHVIKPRQEEDF